MMNLIQKLFCEFLKLEKARRNPDPKDTNKTLPYMTLIMTLMSALNHAVKQCQDNKT